MQGSLQTDITAQIERLEAIARKLEATPAQRQQWHRLVTDYGDRFITNLPESKVYQQTSGQGSGVYDLPIPETPRTMEELLEVVGEEVDKPGINPASGFHFGYVPGGGVFPTALGDYLAAVSNRYAGIFFANPGAVRMENQLLRWMCRLVGYPEGSLGNLASGGSIANLIAITTARDVHGIRAAEVAQAVVYLSGHTHHCVHKALRIAGLGECILRNIPMDDRYRLRADLLAEQLEADRAAGLKPFLVVASAGTTDVGAIDPLDEIADLAEEYGLWYHIDAAYGGFFMLSDKYRPLFRGIERSDSLAIDPHKGLFLAYGIGAILIKDVAAQQRAHFYRANYMQDSFDQTQEPSPADLSPELTKHFRGLRMWLPLQLFGIAPFRAALEEKILLCRYFYEKVQELGFTVGPYPELSIMIFRYEPPQGDADTFNQRLIHAVQADGRVFLSSTTIDGEFWIRFAVLSFRSHRREVDRCLNVLVESL